ncbi:hypothetical protein CA236_16035 [Sphingomonas sp. ABOLG]|nr:hypothetical protein CA236_16035 [Sphingomonas sp. ABOLG]
MPVRNVSPLAKARSIGKGKRRVWLTPRHDTVPHFPTSRSDRSIVASAPTASTTLLHIRPFVSSRMNGTASAGSTPIAPSPSAIARRSGTRSIA